MSETASSGAADRRLDYLEAEGFDITEIDVGFSEAEFYKYLEQVGYDKEAILGIFGLSDVDLSPEEQETVIDMRMHERQFGNFLSHMLEEGYINEV